MLLTVAGTVGAAAMSGGPAAGTRTALRAGASPVVRRAAPVAAQPLPHAAAVGGIHALLRARPYDALGGPVLTQCRRTSDARSLGETSLSEESYDALRVGRERYRADVQRVVVAMIREAVASADARTRAAFESAERLVPAWVKIIVEPPVAMGRTAEPVVRHAPYALLLRLEDDRGEWREFALSLASDVPSLITPVGPCGPRHRYESGCWAQTYGPVFWGERWDEIESRIDEDDLIRVVWSQAPMSVAAGWPSPDTTVLESPDMAEVAEILVETMVKRRPRDRRATLGTDGDLRNIDPAHPRHNAAKRSVAGHDVRRTMASRLALSGLECLAAVVRDGRFHDDAIALLQHLWPAAPERQAEDSVATVYGRESFSSALGRGVQWSLPPDVFVEYRPDLTQNGVQVFDIDGVLYGITVARTRRHASDLRPLEDIRHATGPSSLCRISRGPGTDIDGMCLECHTERDGEVAVTEQGATVAQHQPVEASPLVRLRLAVYARPFDDAQGHRAFFAFGRLGRFDEHGVPHVPADAPRVPRSAYPPELDGELNYYEQATTDGPVAGRRVSLTLGDMTLAAPFGTYRDRHGALYGVVRLAPDTYYRFTPPSGATTSSAPVRLSYRRAEHRDIREYRMAQRHRAAAENAIVLPMIAHGETRTLLQLYLHSWERAPSPAEVWRGLEDIELSVVEARDAVAALTRAIEVRVNARRQPAVSNASGSAAALEIDATLLPMFNRLWARWQQYPAQREAFINAIARDFVSRPAPLAVWSQLPFVSDVETTREVLGLFETLFPELEGLGELVNGTPRAARSVQDPMRAIAGNGNLAVAQVTLADGTQTLYYCRSGLQQRVLRTNASGVRVVDAGQAYARRTDSVVTQRLSNPGAASDALPTEPPELRLAMADADLPTYQAAAGRAQDRTLDTERMILAQIYAEHPAGENVIQSILLCSRLPFCDSCAVNLAMVPYRYPDAALRFHYIAPAPHDRPTLPNATPAPRRDV
ncbi:hypothetical protein RO07_21470 [Pandoraea pulmonicola]|uniref:Uncharacterized protein n=2 Tax=Pandoraea pulmonicola TaxID=93221 RepID=A0AAJ4ZHE2_PANPU|nr:hypothetical protein RO07_21470 [Pandoraea pulmonicola]SUA93477.1 Uncharacterised protein [Pandoraea pulmonicola]